MICEDGRQRVHYFVFSCTFCLKMFTALVLAHVAAQNIMNPGGLELVHQMQTSDVVVSKTLPKMPSLPVRGDHVPPRPIMPIEACVEDASTSHTEAHSENDSIRSQLTSEYWNTCVILVHAIWQYTHNTHMTCTQHDMWPQTTCTCQHTFNLMLCVGHAANSGTIATPTTVHRHKTPHAA